MKLTDKDKDFMEHLKPLLEENELTIELKKDGVKRLVLRQNYGDKVEKTFNMSRQGVRWRFYHLFNEIYVEAYEIIFWVESHFGIDLRQKAIEIARERVELRKKAQKIEFVDAYRLKNEESEAENGEGELTRELPS